MNDAAARLAPAIADALKQGRVADKPALQRLKQRLSAEQRVAVPRDADLLPHLPGDVRERFLPLLRKKPTRSGSGVAIVAVMSSPAACPHGKCVYCPGGPDVDAPQSYTGFEPSTMRAKRYGYDPYRIVRHRLGQLAANGHAVEKVDVVIQGGTFPARDEAYRDWFVAGIYAGCNDGPDAEGPDGFDDPADWEAMTHEARSDRLAALQRANEEAACRVIGLTIETKPDWCLEPHVDAMLRYGATRIELGIQTLDEAVLRATNRGHGVQESMDAMRIARDAGFKVCVHMMPGLPRAVARGSPGMAEAREGLGPAGSDPGDGPTRYTTDPDQDLEDFRRLFAEPAWMPDMLKIYPTLVVADGETPLKRWFLEGRFEPYDTATARDLLVLCKPLVPEWCRIQRIDRDIPTTHVLGGVMNSNLRQIVQDEMARRGLAGCRCIRCREVHRRAAEGRTVEADRLRLVRRAYTAADGDEVFLAWEDPEADALAGFLRLRHVGPDPHRPEFRPGPDEAGRRTAVVRELKVYGTAQALGTHDDPGHGAWQHQGLGARLLAEAERIARDEWDAPRLLVIAGPGVKPYYRRHDYQDRGPYVAKEL